MKATEQYFPVVLFIVLYKMVLTFESVDEILKYDHSNGSYWAVLSCGIACYAVQSGSNFWGMWMKQDTQSQFSENICSEDDLKSRIFGTFVVKFPACLHLLGFSKI